MLTNGTDVVYGSSWGRAISAAGIITSRPNMAIFGVTPVVLWTVMRYAAMTAANLWGHVPGFSSAVVFNIWRRVLFILSVCPSLWG